MTGEYYLTQEITKAERERDELGERVGIQSEEHTDKDREARNFTSDRKAGICERMVTTAKAKKEVVNPA